MALDVISDRLSRKNNQYFGHSDFGDKSWPPSLKGKALPSLWGTGIVWKVAFLDRTSTVNDLEMSFC
jgi:hypothetical protein